MVIENAQLSWVIKW